MDEKYFTTNIDLASLPMALGYKVRAGSRDGTTTYEFEHSDKLQSDVENYFNDTPITFRPRTLLENNRQLRIALAEVRRGFVPSKQKGR